eukprot:scaffold270_cov309-Pinguiococcus_pyrenoidosus.AAC.3
MRLRSSHSSYALAFTGTILSLSPLLLHVKLAPSMYTLFRVLQDMGIYRKYQEVRVGYGYAFENRNGFGNGYGNG